MSEPQSRPNAAPPCLPGPDLTELGWDDGWAAACADAAASAPAAAAAALLPGRVARTDRGRCLVLTGDGIRSASVPAALPEPPTTGDWVLVDVDPAEHRATTRVVAVLPRRSAFVRGAGRRDTRAQVLAANIDVALVVVALSEAPNLSRLERLLTLAWESGAAPVVVLTKADLSSTAETERDQVAAAALGAPVHLTSCQDGRGFAELAGDQLAPGRTLALLGTSGSGKSSLVNALAGRQVLATGDIRADGKGRHTSTARELVVLPGVGVLLDTPGLRGVQLWDAAQGLEQTFADMERLAASCRFADCSHTVEPGCEVRAALGDGRLTGRRLESWTKLQREQEWLASRHDARLRAAQRKQWRTIARDNRARGSRPC